MAVLQHGKYIIVARPHLDENLGVWVPYASVAWQDDEGYRFHRFTNLIRTFLTQEEAEGFGMVVARAWLEKER
jgi:hypothetical protein